MTSSFEIVDIGDVASVPPDRREDVDEPDDNGLGKTGAEDVSDVPEGDPGWIDPEGDLEATADREPAGGAR